MCFDYLKLCRLCMSTTHLEELYITDGDTSLLSIIFFCINIKIQPGDGLPARICSDCLKKLKMFNNFKQVCLDVDLKFKNMIEKSSHVFNEISIYKQEMPAYCDTIKIRNDSSSTSKIYENNLNLRLETNVTVQNKKINMLSNSFQCDQCGRMFKMKTVLEKHMTTHTGAKPYICKICQKRFTRAESRIIHMRSHLGIKPYVCEMCGSSSTKRQDLIRHMKIHSDERKYSCPVCNRNFKRSSDIHSHMRTHTGIRPYTCNICEKTYTSHSGLTKHYKTHCKKEKIK